MQASNQPIKLSVPFAQSGEKNTIPESPTGTGAASFADGFPAKTSLDPSAGGVPPDRKDFNGVLNAISANSNWQNAGGGYSFDNNFSSKINGYPKGARILSSDSSGYWLNTVDNNATDPDSINASGWVKDSFNGVTTITMGSFNVTLNPSEYKYNVIILTGALTADLALIFPKQTGFWTVINKCTGNFYVLTRLTTGNGHKIFSGENSTIVCDGLNIYPASSCINTPDKLDYSTKITNTAWVRDTASSLTLNGDVFVDAGGSTVSVRNLKPLNNNLILSKNPADWVGSTITTSFITDTSTAITIKIYNNYNELILTRTVDDSSYLISGKIFDIYIADSVAIIKNLTNIITTYFGNSQLLYDANKVVGQRWFRYSSIINNSNTSTTDFQYVTLPFSATYMSSPIASGCVAANQGGNLLDTSINFADIQTGNKFAYQFYRNGTRNVDGAFSYQITGKF